MILVDDHRELCIGVFVEAVGQQDPCAQVHIAAPELAERIAFEAHVLEPFCRRTLGRNHHRVAVGALNGRHDLVERELDGVSRFGIEVNLHRLVVRVAGLRVPVLALALVGRQPHRSCPTRGGTAHTR